MNDFDAKVAMVAHLPPPITGVSAINEFMAEELLRKGLLELCINLTPPGKRGGVIYGLRRAWCVMRASAALYSKRRTAKVLYMPVDGGRGLIFNIMLAMIARAIGYRLFVHHHSFAYINKWSPLMSTLLRIMSAEDFHVFLCDDMARRFDLGYSADLKGNSTNSKILNNGFMLENPEGFEDVRRPGEVLTIGHLSNLSALKGTDLFLDLVESILQKDMTVRAILAGPVAESKLGKRIDELLQSYTSRFTWVGFVTGEEKSKFFRSIDLFVFPTQYEHEAQPLVLLEALSYAVPIMVIKRGCIGCDYTEMVGLISPDRADFISRSEIFIRQYVANRSEAIQMRKRALSLALNYRACALLGLSDLFAAMRGSKGSD